MSARRPTGLTRDAALLDEAKALGLNVSRAAQEGVLRAVKALRAKSWAAEDAELISEYNRMVTQEAILCHDIRLSV